MLLVSNDALVEDCQILCTDLLIQHAQNGLYHLRIHTLQGAEVLSGDIALLSKCLRGMS